VFEGTVIETVLTNRLTSAFAGPVNCLVTVPVYAADREHLVIPQGSRVLGEVKRVDAVGQERLAVTFHRVIRPDGSAVSLDQFQGLSQMGKTGLRDQIDHHYLQIFGLSTAIGALAGLAQYHTRYSAIDTSANDAYRQGVSSSLAQSSMHVLDRYLNVVPTFTIREGHRISVYLSQDLMLAPYPLDTTRMPGKEE
jgi:type IV secretion system protein VirB10